MSARAPFARRLGLVLLWWIAAAALVGLAGALAAGIAWASAAAAGSEVGEVQREVWRSLARAVAVGALAPMLSATVLFWWAAATWRPGLDASWRPLLLGLPLVAALVFPPVGAFGFTVWTPGTPWDYLGTLLLLAGGTAAPLLLARRLLPVLAPGALAGRRERPREAGKALRDA